MREFGGTRSGASTRLVGGLTARPSRLWALHRCTLPEACHAGPYDSPKTASAEFEQAREGNGQGHANHLLRAGPPARRWSWTARLCPSGHSHRLSEPVDPKTNGKLSTQNRYADQFS